MAGDRYHHGDLRNALVDAATAMLREGGLEAFSLRAVARHVGVSANAAYRHFPDRSALLSEVARSGYEALGARMQKGRRRGRKSESPAVRAFKDTGRAYVEFALEEPALFRLMFGEDRAARAGAAAPDPSPYGMLSEGLDALALEGYFGAERRRGAEAVAWSAVHGFAALLLSGALTYPSVRERSRALDRLLDHTVRGLQHA